MNTRPVVVGFGPAGMFASLILAEAGYQPIVVERGSMVSLRKESRYFWQTGSWIQNAMFSLEKVVPGLFQMGN